MLKKQKPGDLFTLRLNSYWAYLTLKPPSITAGKKKPKMMKMRFFKIQFPGPEIKPIYFVILNSYNSDSKFYFS